jgi:mannosyltransferase
VRILLPVYACLLLILSPRLSLWLDEILTLIGAAEPSMSSLLDYIKTVPGGSPLAFLAPRWSIEALGYSVFAARLPSVVASVAACPAIYLLAKRLKIQAPILAVLVFALWPLQVRYAMEARPYALALAFSVWSTEVFLSLPERPGRKWLYVALTVLASLTQPYALFVTAAHLFYGRIAMVAIAVSAAALIPWYAHFRADWAAVNAAQQLPSFDLKSFLVILHEISGSGYPGTAILLVGIALSLRRSQRFWLIGVAIPIIAVFVANATFHYFFAARQLIFILPALTLLFAYGITEPRLSGRGQAARILLVAFLAASLYEDVQWFRKPRENWQAAADAINTEVSKGACVQLLGDSTPVYEFFYPSLAQHHCEGQSAYVVVGTSAYVAPAARPVRSASTRDFNGPRVIVEKR